jgi:hypothetical protein
MSNIDDQFYKKIQIKFRLNNRGSVNLKQRIKITSSSKINQINTILYPFCNRITYFSPSPKKEIYHSDNILNLLYKCGIFR